MFLTNLTPGSFTDTVEVIALGHFDILTHEVEAGAVRIAPPFKMQENCRHQGFLIWTAETRLIVQPSGIPNQADWDT
jgi:hypothetical protein